MNSAPQSDSLPKAAPQETSQSTGIAPQPQGSDTPPAVSAAKKDEVVLSPVLGAIEGLTEVQQAELYACEEVIGSGWNTFVQVGLALARIRDGELYLGEYDSFEAYYRVKWEYRHRQIYYLISAAKLFTHLCTNCAQRKPDHESQLRPLIGLGPEQAQSAWERAVEKAAGRKITARLVKAAVQELNPPGGAKPVPSQPHQNKAEQRKLIDGAIGELLVLLSQKASHEVLTQKVESLHGQIQALFPRPSAKK